MRPDVVAHVLAGRARRASCSARPAACSAPDRRGPARRFSRSPSTATTAAAGSTRVPSWVTTRPSTVTRPSVMRFSQARREPSPAEARPSAAGRRPQRTLPSSSSPSSSMSGSSGASEGNSSRPAQAQLLQEQICGRVQAGAGLGVGPDLGDQPAADQGARHRVDADTADRRNASPGHRLAVGDDRESLQGRLRELAALTLAEEPFHSRGVLLAGVETVATGHRAQLEAGAALGQPVPSAASASAAPRPQDGPSAAASEVAETGVSLTKRTASMAARSARSSARSSSRASSWPPRPPPLRADPRRRRRAAPRSRSVFFLVRGGAPTVPCGRAGPAHPQLGERSGSVERDRPVPVQLQQAEEPGHRPRACWCSPPRACGTWRAGGAQQGGQDGGVLAHAHPWNGMWSIGITGRWLGPHRRARRSLARSVGPMSQQHVGHQSRESGSPARPPAGSGAARRQLGQVRGGRAYRRGTAGAGRKAGPGSSRATSSHPHLGGRQSGGFEVQRESRPPPGILGGLSPKIPVLGGDADELGLVTWLSAHRGDVQLTAADEAQQQIERASKLSSGQRTCRRRPARSRPRV